MIRRMGIIALLVCAGAAFAEPPTAITPRLTASDAIGKQLLDAQGGTIGHIEVASTYLLTVRTPDGQVIVVQMAGLSLGARSNTVITGGK